MRHPQAASPLDKLKAAVHRFDPFEALRHLQRYHRNAGRARIRATVTNRHVSAPLTGFNQRPDGDCEIDVAFVGLAAPLGPLPPSYTETALLARKHRSHSLAAFFDIFVQRFANLFVRAGEKYRLAAPVAREAANHATAGGGIAEALFALVGLALPPLRGRLAFPDSELLPYAGMLGHQTRSAASLEIMLSDLLNLPVSIEPFNGRWTSISKGEQTRLDDLAPQYSRLGIDAIAGTRFWDVQGQFRIVIGPLGYSDFVSLSPDKERMRRVVELARLYAGAHLRFDVQLLLAKESVPECRLSGTTAMLGWNTWIRLLPSIRDSGDAVHSVEI
jgi:type VI secretion system protein ImpH